MESITKIFMGLIIAIVLYSVAGACFLSEGTTIYCDIPKNETFTISSEKTFTIYIQNNARLTFPFVEPLFSGRVKLIEPSGNTTCMTQVIGGDNVRCEDYNINLGTIPSGEIKSFGFTIEPNGENFTIEMDAFSNSIITQKLSKQKIVECVCIKWDGNNYTYRREETLV